MNARPDSAPWPRRLAWHAQALPLGMFWACSSLLPPPLAAAAGSRLFRWLGPLTRKQRFVARNLELAYPELGAAARDAIARDVWSNFGAVLAEYPHLGRYAAPGAGALETEVHPATRMLLDAGRPAVFVTAHLANWELPGLALSRLGIPLSVVYAPQSNPHVDAMLQRHRSALGCDFVPKTDSIRTLLAALKAGRSVGLLSDQRTDFGEQLPFFGRPAMTAISPAWLALRQGCPLVPVRAGRRAQGSYRVRVLAPLVGDDASRAGVLALSRRLNALFESWIRERPGQWLCMRRRWPGRIEA
ncbi:lysophospholipid acyltransferase family protein [Pseudohaliea sp.]|uniref:lysophospholipid acyltransferase family protein n=1 Tax=Pseudohaliea sp. TaxID=2740289 RepID=UPI0032EDD6B4